LILGDKMAKYRKKPVIIEAEQFFFTTKPWPDGVKQTTPTDRRGQQCAPIHCWIDTLEGCHIVTNGDWIITGIKGEKYPCKPDIFEATYELVG